MTSSLHHRPFCIDLVTQVI